MKPRAQSGAPPTQDPAEHLAILPRQPRPSILLTLSLITMFILLLPHDINAPITPCPVANRIRSSPLTLCSLRHRRRRRRTPVADAPLVAAFILAKLEVVAHKAAHQTTGKAAVVSVSEALGIRVVKVKDGHGRGPRGWLRLRERRERPKRLPWNGGFPKRGSGLGNIGAEPGLVSTLGVTLGLCELGKRWR